MNAVEWIELVAIGLMGLAFGSFANVVIWRLPRGESLSRPGSHCPACDTPIAWYDNVPLLGWLLLRGRCRSCGGRISVRYPLVEVLAAVLWLGAFAAYGLTLRFLFAAMFFYLLMLLSFIDLDTMRLPNKLVALTAAIGLGGVVLGQILGVAVVPLLEGGGRLSNPFVFAISGVLLGGLIPLAMSGAYRLVRGVAGLGMGDVKLLAVIGVFLGPYVVLALFIGSAIGSVSSVIVGVGRGAARKIPFGPFLAAGAAATAFVGTELVGWYLSFL